MTASTISALTGRFPAVKTSEFRGQTRVVVPAESIYAALEFLKNERHFDFLVDITCVDYLNYRGATDRFGLVYLLAGIDSNERLTVRTFLQRAGFDGSFRSAAVEGANWFEREVWDMFGIQFAGHPDLRRILMPEEFTAFPLRKDYPLQGRGERHNFPVLSRNNG